MFADSPARWPEILTGFDEAAQTMGLHTSWTKMKLQNGEATGFGCLLYTSDAADE